MRGILRSAVAVGLLGFLGAVGVEAQVRVVLGVGGGTISPLSKSKWTVGSGTPVKSLGYGAQFMIGARPPTCRVAVRLAGHSASVNPQLASGPTTRAKDKHSALGRLDAD